MVLRTFQRIACQAASWIKVALGLSCVFLLCVDVISNNWEIINYVGDAKHLLTPLLTVPTTAALVDRFAFPALASPSQVSQIGQFMVNTTLAQIQARGSDTFILGTTQHLIKNAKNDICGQLVRSYPIADANATFVQLGTLDDFVTFIRGNALSHWFGDTKSAPQATRGMNETQMRAMGYSPARHATDLRLTTPVTIPPPRQTTTATVSMFRFFMRTFSTGSKPGTELGLDTCVLEYSYNNQTNTLDVASSRAILGHTHEVGFIFQRRGGPVAALYVRMATLALLFGVYTATQKTVQWVDFVQASAPRRLQWLIAPPTYRQTSEGYSLSDICFNSDVFVVLYTLAVLADEEISMVYSRNMNWWHANGGTDLWLDLRLLSMTARWLWVNCFLLKATKWSCNFVSLAQHTGDNRVMEWLNFSSVSWMYASVFVLFERHEFIEFGSSVRMDLPSTTQNLDATPVVLLDSWYIRSLPALAVAILANLVVLLVADHVANRRWWQSVARNSLGRQLMFNSTSILTNFQGDLGLSPHGQGTTVTMTARVLCTFRWFLSSHMTRFGLPEPPTAVRAIAAKARSPKRVFVSASKANSSEAVSNLALVPDVVAKADSVVLPDDVAVAQLLMLQDRDGHLHLVNETKQDIQAATVEAKIATDELVTVL